jgi:thymidylate kinase
MFPNLDLPVCAVEGGDGVGKTPFIKALLEIMPNAFGIKTPPQSMRAERELMQQKLNSGEINRPEFFDFYMRSIVEAYRTAPRNTGIEMLVSDRWSPSTYIADELYYERKGCVTETEFTNEITEKMRIYDRYLRN